jgi:hypothetical protein
MHRLFPSPAATASPPRRAVTVERIDPERWDALVRELPERTVFHLSPWLRALASVQGRTVVRLAALEDGAVVALWPCIVGRKGSFPVLGSPFPGSATPYLGPLFAAGSDAAAALGALLANEPIRGAAYVACRVMERAPAVDLAAHGFRLRRRFETSWIDLDRPESEIWNGLKSECRTRIRRAEKLGVEIRAEEDESFLDDLWRMTLETFARSGTTPTHTRELLAEVWRELHPSGQLLVLSAFREGRRIAALVLPHDDRTLYYWAGAAADRDRSVPAANLLHWRAIGEARRRGIRGYDMISAAGGTGRFKRTFGAQTVAAAVHWERASSPLVSVAVRIYETYLRRRFGMKGEAAEEHAA